MSKYSDLLVAVRRAGLLEPRRRYYGAVIAISVGLYVAGWTAFLTVADSWWQVGVAIFLALAFGQCAFVVHDAGHRQILRTRAANDVLGVVFGNLVLGFAYGWWVAKHRLHHLHPNHHGKDPDIVNKFVALTVWQGVERGGSDSWLVRNQWLLFVPFSALQAMSMRVHSFQAMMARGYRRRLLELPLAAIHMGAYIIVILAVLPPIKAAVFMAVHQAALGLYLVCAFAPNHKGMPALHDGVELDFVERQVIPSRNVLGGRLVDWFLGGLNYQIEHHLFPSMPRSNLRRARPLVRQFCLDQGIPYVETSLHDSIMLVFRHLRDVGRSSDTSGSSADSLAKAASRPAG